MLHPDVQNRLMPNYCYCTHTLWNRSGKCTPTSYSQDSHSLGSDSAKFIHTAFSTSWVSLNCSLEWSHLKVKGYFHQQRLSNLSLFVSKDASCDLFCFCGTDICPLKNGLRPTTHFTISMSLKKTQKNTFRFIKGTVNATEAVVTQDLLMQNCYWSQWEMSKK